MKVKNRNSAFKVLAIFTFHPDPFGQILVPIVLPPKAGGSFLRTVILFRRSGCEAWEQPFALPWSAYLWTQKQVFSLEGKTLKLPSLIINDSIKPSIFSEI